MSATKATVKAATVEPATKVVLLTGAAKLDGIGFAAAKQLLSASKTTHVVLTGRSAADGPKVLEALKKDGLTNASYEVLDHTDAKSVDAVLAAVYTKHNKIDVLINNAGAAVGFGVMGADTKIADMSSAFDINTLGPFRLILAVLPRMRAAGYGRIVNVTSLAGDFKLLDGDWNGTVAYRVAKLSLNAIGKLLAGELKGSGVLVNAFAPGPVATAMLKGASANAATHGEEFDASKFGGVITPEQCAKGLVRLATLPVGSTEAGQIVNDR